MTNDFRAMHVTALTEASGYVGRIEAADLSRPTPCAEWNLGDLLAHMVGQHLGFAAAVRDGDAPATAYVPVPFSWSAWEESVAELTDSFAGADLGGQAVAVELTPQPLPMAVVIGAQFIDTVIHTWDVARGLGDDYTPPDDVAAAVFEIARAIPDDEKRDRPGAAFAHALPVSGTPWEQTLAVLGRAPVR